MAQAFVFGYGSLLADAAGIPCALGGHRRRFGVAMDNRRTIPGYKYFLAPDGGRPQVCVAFLDLEEDGAGTVDGVAFGVDAAVLAALDARERNYARVEVTDLLDADLGAPVWAFAGLPEARERYTRAAAAGTAVVSRAYLDGVREGFAAYGLGFHTEPSVPVVDLVRVEVPANGNGAG